MGELLLPPTLVATWHLTSYGQVQFESFEVDSVFRPVWTNPDVVYSIETHREGYSIRDLGRTLPVDLATWLHRAGVWDTTPET